MPQAPQLPPQEHECLPFFLLLIPLTTIATKTRATTDETIIVGNITTPPIVQSEQLNFHTKLVAVMLILSYKQINKYGKRYKC